MTNEIINKFKNMSMENSKFQEINEKLNKPNRFITRRINASKQKISIEAKNLEKNLDMTIVNKSNLLTQESLKKILNKFKIK